MIAAYSAEVADSLACADHTRVRYFDSRSSSNDDEWLGDDEINERLTCLGSLSETLVPTLQTHQGNGPGAAAPFVLITTTGDGIMSRTGDDALGMRRTTLDSLIQTCGFPERLKRIYLLRQPHQSRHVHFAKDETTPVAITLILRAGRNSQIINGVIRIRLSDLASVCLLSSRHENLALDLHTKCLNDISLMGDFPGHIMTIILARLMEENMIWLRNCWSDVGRVESATGMHPPGWVGDSPDPELKRGDYGPILQKLHDVNVHLCLAQTIMVFAAQLGAFCSENLDVVGTLQNSAGYPQLKQGKLARLREEVEFYEEVCRHSGEKFTELRSRVQAQVNVTFSLVAQRDSLIAQRDSKVGLFIAGSSTQIAKLAAQDSRSMKTITVVTLIFLPLNLVTTVWSADIFNLGSGINWAIYLSSSTAFSAVVFAAWFRYNKGAAERQKTRMDEPSRLHIPGVGWVENGKVLVDVVV